MTRTLAALVMLLAWTAGVAQPSKQRSAQYWLGLADSREKLDSLTALSYSMAKDKPDSSILLARAAAQCARTIGDELSVALAYRRIGMGLKRTGDVDSALFYLREAMDIDRKAGNDEGILSCAQKIAPILQEQGQASEALDMLILALEISKRTKDREQEARTLNLMGPVYTSLGRMEPAVECLFAGLEIRKQLGKDGDLMLSYQNIGAMYRDFERYDKAEEYFRTYVDMARRLDRKADMAAGYQNLCAIADRKKDHEALRNWADSALILFKLVKQPVGQAKALANRAVADMQQARYEDAARALDEALAVLAPLGRVEDVAVVHVQMADLALRRKDLGRAAQELETALDITRDKADQTRTHMKALQRLAEVRKEQGRLDDALGLYEQYQTLREKRLNETATEQLAVAEMREKYETELRVKEIEELKAQKALEQETNVRRLWQRNAFIGLAILLLTLSLLLWRNNQHIRRLRAQESELHAQRVNDLLQQQEIRSLDAMMQGQEKERQRIAQDLHDRLGSMLSAIKLQFSALEGRMTQMESSQREQYQRVFNLLDEAVTEVRRVSHDMVRGVLSQFGLRRALEDLRGAIEVPGKLQVELSVYELEERLEPKLEIAIYRMIQEAVSNALKHAHASELTIQITRSAGSINVIVEDNGSGIDPAASEGMGMGNIRARAAEFKGVVQVDTRAGRGTAISIDIPLV